MQLHLICCNQTTQGHMGDIKELRSTVISARMSHWKWRETKLQPSRARSGHQISCCLVSLHFLCDILAPITVMARYQFLQEMEIN